MEKERRLISKRTKDALAAKKAQGVKLGGLNAGGIRKRDEALGRAEQLRPIFAELAGMSARGIAAVLNERQDTDTGRRSMAQRHGASRPEASRHGLAVADVIPAPSPVGSTMTYNLWV